MAPWSGSSSLLLSVLLSERVMILGLGAFSMARYNPKWRLDGNVEVASVHF